MAGPADQLQRRRHPVGGQTAGNRDHRQSGAAPWSLEFGRSGGLKRGRGRGVGRWHDQRLDVLKEGIDAAAKVALPRQGRRVVDPGDRQPFVEQDRNLRAIALPMVGKLPPMVLGRLDRHDPPVHRRDLGERPLRKSPLGQRDRLDPRTGVAELGQGRFGRLANRLVGLFHEKRLQKSQTGRMAALGNFLFTRPGQRTQQDRRVGDGSGHRAGVIQVIADRNDPFGRDATERRLARDDAAIACRTNQRPARLGADSPQTHPQRHRHGRSAAGAAGCVPQRGVPGIACGRRIEAGEFDGHGLAEDDRPGPTQVADQRRISPGEMVFAQRRPRPGGERFDVDDVLDP